MDIKLPHLGEGADSGVVVGIFVKIGDPIAEGQNLIELETGKAIAAIPASAGGTIEQIRVKVGDKITPGTVIATVSGGTAPAVAAATPTAKSTQAAEPAKRPTSPSPPALAPEPEEMEMPTVESTGDTFGPPASPTIRKLARDLGVDLRRVRGSQHGGRIVMDDLRRYIQALIQQVEKARATPPPASSFAPTAGWPLVNVDFSQWGPVTKKPMSQLREVVARRMLESASTLPQVNQFDEADITNLLAWRKKYAAAFEAKGAKLTLTGFAIAAVVQALKKHPHFNASLNEVTREIVFKEYYHIGIAVDTEAGLLVPVIRDADKQSLLQLSQELSRFADKARDRKLAPADMQGGSFTISNQGGMGGWYFTPIINKPEAAILGLGKAALRPAVLSDGSIAARMLMPMVVSYDHRLIDGASAARFIVDLRAAFEHFPEEQVKKGLE